MAETNISVQLKHDYPDQEIIIDAENQVIRVNDFKNVLLLSTSSIQHMNIFSSAGKHFYQVIVNLIYSRFDILPAEGSYADSLIIRKEDVREYRIKRLADLFKLGFLEDDDDIMAVGIDSGTPLPLLLEEDPDDPLSDDEFEDNFQYYRYSFWRDDDPSLEELEVVDEVDQENGDESKNK